MPRPSFIAVLRANAQILELMAAQLETLATRISERDAAQRLQRVASRTRLLSAEYQETAVVEGCTAALASVSEDNGIIRRT